MSALLLRDLKLAIRAGGGFGLALSFFLILVVLVPLGVGPEMAVLSAIAPGVLWLGALLSCLLSLDRIFVMDHEDGTLDLLLTSPMPLEAIIITKAFAHWITTGLPLSIVAPLLAVLLGLPSAGYFWLTVSLLIGTPALSLIGTFGAALTLGLKRGGLLLSVLVLPLYIPTMIFGTEVARRGVEGATVQTPLLLLAGISFGTVAILPIASSAVLRINLR